MDLSGLIFVALAVVWAVVLIPMALRHHDETAKTRAVDNFSDDLRVVARREAVTTRESRLVVPSRGPGPRDLRPPTPATVPAPAPLQAQSDSEPASVRSGRAVAAHRTAARAAAKRRRVVLGVLVLGTAGTGLGSYLGTLQPWAPAVPVTLVLGFLVLARVLVRREHAAWQVVTAERPAARRTEVAHAPEVVDVVSPSPAQPAGSSSPPVVSGLDDTCAVPVGLIADGAPVEGLWDPLPMTLPTYVTKPRAQRSVRTIDLLDPGVVSSGRNAADSALVAEAATAPPEEQDRRAVGH